MRVVAAEPGDFLRQPRVGVRHQFFVTAIPELVAVRDGAGNAAARGLEAVLIHRLGGERRQVAVPIDDFSSRWPSVCSDGSQGKRAHGRIDCIYRARTRESGTAPSGQLAAGLPTADATHLARRISRSRGISRMAVPEDRGPMAPGVGRGRRGIRPPARERRDLGEQVEVAIVVEHGQRVPDGARRDQAVDAGPDGDAGAARRPVEIDRLIEDRCA